MNLYIFNEFRLGAVYGIGTYIRELTIALKNSDLSVCVVNLNSDKPYIKSEEIDGILHWYIPSPIQWKKDLREQWDLYHRNVIYLLRLHIMDKKNLIFHLNYSQKGRLAEDLKKTFDCRIISVVHFSDKRLTVYDTIQPLRSIINEEHSDSPSENLKKSNEKEDLYYSKADRIICLSNCMQEILCRDYDHDIAKISVISNGLSDTADTTNNIQFLRKKWNIQVEEKIIIFVGRLDEAKGLGYLIKAFREILKKYPYCLLIIAGSGNYDAYFWRVVDICTKVTFTGLLKKNDLYELYQMADVGVLPSFIEQCSYVAIEMMMHSLPVITTVAPGLAEMTEDGISSLQVPVIEYPDGVEIDTDLLAKKLLYLLERPAEAKRLGKNARKRYEERYSSYIFRENMLNFYHSLYK